MRYIFVPQTGQADLYTVNANGTGLYQVTHTGLGAGLKDWGTHSLDTHSSSGSTVRVRT